MWRAGKQHGEGLYISHDGKMRKAIWEDGKRERWILNSIRSLEVVEERDAYKSYN